jgi:hypothetical protein
MSEQSYVLNFGCALVVVLQLLQLQNLCCENAALNEFCVENLGASLCTKGRVSDRALEGPAQAQDCTHGLDPGNGGYYMYSFISLYSYP